MYLVTEGTCPKNFAPVRCFQRVSVCSLSLDDKYSFMLYALWYKLYDIGSLRHSWELVRTTDIHAEYTCALLSDPFCLEETFSTNVGPYKLWRSRQVSRKSPEKRHPLLMTWATFSTNSIWQGCICIYIWSITRSEFAAISLIFFSSHLIESWKQLRLKGT